MNSVLLRLASGGTASCSGRNTQILRDNTALRLQHVSRRTARRQGVVVLALYNFADSAEVRVPGQRRNRTLLKKEARSLTEVVRGLTSMSPKQLGAVAHLLPPGTLEAVGIAARLPRSNQGRKRQEGLVAKMLRGQLTEHQMEKLQEAVALVEEGRGVYEDGDVSAMVAAWREGLLGDDPEVVAEVYGYPPAWAPDHQQLRALVRQCQQALAEERAKEATAGADGSGGYGSGSSSGGEDEDADSVLAGGDREDDEDLRAVLGAGGRPRRAGRRSEPPRRSRGLLRSLNKVLRPLAVRVGQEEGGEEE